MQAVERALLPADEIAVILGALNALKRGDASVRLPADWPGSLGRVADVFNDVVERNERMAQELEGISRVVGKEGKLGKRCTMGDVTGFWRDSIDAVNLLIDDLVHPTSETARVIGAVAQGDLSQTMALEVDGEPLQGEFLRTRRPSTRWSISWGRLPRRSRASRVKWEPRESSAARRESRASPGRGKT